MAGRAKGPWMWAQRNRWCVTIAGRRVPLDAHPDDEAGAVLEWHRRVAAADAEKAAPAGRHLPVKAILKLHDDYAKDHLAPETYLWYVRHSKSFAAAHPDLLVADLRPHHVDSWLQAHRWATSTRRGAITAIKAVVRWARKRGYIDADPLEAIERPPRSRRKAIISAGQVAAFRAEMKDDAFRDLFLAVLDTGCRPGEACKVEARDFDPAARTWTVHGKTTGRTGKMRVVYLTEAVVVISARLAEARPTGPLFLNADGRPWTRHAYGHRVRRMRARLGFGREVVLSSLRHLFVTDSLERGVGIATVAEVVGHSGVGMVTEAYSMLHQRAEHLRDAVEMVRGVNSRDRTSGGESGGPAAASGEGPSAKPPRRRRGPTA